VDIFERAGRPKKLIRQTGVKHYDSYLRNSAMLVGEFVGWYRQHLTPVPRGAVTSTESLGTHNITAD
jgi:hypothetical protein